MYYSSGNYGAFATSRKNRRALTTRDAYLIGSGLAALSAACLYGA